MDLIFEPGTSLQTIQGDCIHIDSFLARTGTGPIYKVKINREKKVFRWYSSSMPQNYFFSVWANIRDMVNHGPPCDSILWPEAITELTNDGFGYITQFIPEAYHNLSDFLRRQVGFSSFLATIDTTLNLITAFRTLHNEGYCIYAHNDNIWINPVTRNVIISDPEYIVPVGISLDVLTNPRYSAPEVVMGIGTPGWANDQYVLGVYLFMLLCRNHPLEGKRYLVPGLTPIHQKKLYGSEALFMMDPDDHSNGPHPAIHSNTITLWRCLPDYMRKIFESAFSQNALQRPAARPKEIDWLKALTRFRSEIIHCSCGNEVFIDNGKPRRCNRCNKMPVVPYHLVLNEYSIPATKGARVYRCQLGACAANEALNPVAHIVEKKGSPGVFGIRNMTVQHWDAVTSNGVTHQVAPGEIIPLNPGITLQIFGSELVIKKVPISPQYE